MNDMNAQPATNAPAGSAGTDPDSAYVRISHVTKRFGDFVAVDDVSLDIRRGEIFCLLGGSGSGKTTLLRMLAGFERPSAGTIYIDGVDMSTIPPYERPVNMMFQSYALFPHMSVADNVGYGLRREGLPRREIAERVGKTEQRLPGIGAIQQRQRAIELAAQQNYPSLPAPPHQP